MNRVIQYVLIVVVFTLIACNGKRYNNPTSSMADTLEEGGSFIVKRTKKFERNDIVVYDYYGDNYLAPLDEVGKFEQHWERRVSRIIAISGDTVNIERDDVFINKKAVPLPEKARLPYIVYTNSEIDELLPSQENLTTRKEVGSSGFIYRSRLSKAVVRKLQQQKPSVTQIIRDTQYWSDYTTNVFYASSSARDKWNSANYGPLYIPLPGQTIEINDDNYRLYQNIPAVKKGMFTVTEPLYFLMGDDRYGAQDSRFIGFISHSNMFGVVK